MLSKDGLNGKISEKKIKAHSNFSKISIKFGFIFIICATGKSAEEMVKELKIRFHNDRLKELENAAIEQNKITQIRLEKL